MHCVKLDVLNDFENQKWFSFVKQVSSKIVYFCARSYLRDPFDLCNFILNCAVCYQHLHRRPIFVIMRPCRLLQTFVPHSMEAISFLQITADI